MARKRTRAGPRRSPRSLPGRLVCGTLAVGYEGDTELEGALGGLKGNLRLEYLRDPDLLLDMPRVHNLPILTTLVGMAATVRYTFVEGLDAASSTRSTSSRRRQERQDRAQRWEHLQMVQDHEVMLDLIGYF